MKKLIVLLLLPFILFAVRAQANKSEILQSLEGNNIGKTDQQNTATLKSASRLFREKENLSSVIIIIPSGTIVNIISTDSTYLKVSFEENEGYIFRRDAVINTLTAVSTPTAKKEDTKQIEEFSGEKQVGRFTYLEQKYGASMATRLFSGKIWKGMSSEMVKDSWGSPLKINREIGEFVKEEWIYKNSWLFIENDVLKDWGPVKK